MRLSRTSSASWHVLIPFIFLFHTSISLSFRDLFSGQAQTDRLDTGHQKPFFAKSTTAEGLDNGASKVREAVEHLGAVPTPSLIQLDKKPGFVGTTAYYAKEVFVILFMNGPSQATPRVNGKDAPLAKPLSTAVQLLEEARKADNPDALFLLAEMNFWGNYTHPRNYDRAFQYYEELATINGNSTAQYMLGFFYATGLGDVVQRDQAKAQLYHTFAAQQGNTRSEMTLAFRSHSEIGTPKDCDTAAQHYQSVAEKAIAFSRSGPPGGLALPRDAYRLADEEGGVYGEGASWTSSGQFATQKHPGSDQNAALEDVLEYIDVLSRKGDLKATFSLGRLHYDGDKGLPRNYRIAQRYFTKVARKYWDKDGNVISEDKNGIGKLASKAAAYLGRLYLRGEGVEQNFGQAMRWFKLGLQTGEAFCQYEIGLMYLLGLGVREDPVKASTYLKQAALQDWPAAQARLGRLFLDQGDLKTAATYFELAARRGHIEGIYYLAEINNMRLSGRDRNCGAAVNYYKIVVEKVEALHSDFAEANRLFEEEGDKEGALVRYMMAAEQGYEAAQANVAWLLDEQRSVLRLDQVIPSLFAATAETRSLMKNAALALIYWARSARQLNVDSTVKMGDAYFHGLGLPNGLPDIDKAVACYTDAAEKRGSAQAFWNLGWLHENGIGVEQDFHLAKRFYDLALETAPESYLPVKLALWKLRMRSRWNDWIGGDVKSMEYEEEQVRYKTWSEWLQNFLDDDNQYYQEEGGVQHFRQDGEDAYMWEDDGLGDDYLDDIDTSVLETLIIFSLAGALAWLVYFRQLRQQEAQRRQQQHQQQQQQQEAREQRPPNQENGHQPAGPIFPPADDPNFNNWRAPGGVGH